MTKKAYHDGFVQTCTGHGLNKEAAEKLYKEASKIGILKQFWRGIKGLGGPMKDIFTATGRAGAKGIEQTGKGLEWINNYKPPKVNHSIAKWFTRGAGRKVPLLKSFGKGFAQAQREYERAHSIGGSIMANLGFGKGGLIGNSLAGMGTFTAAHPYLGALGFTIPAAMLAKRFSEKDDEEGTIDTMTPSQRRAYERVFKADGYSGLGFDADDVSAFGYL